MCTEMFHIKNDVISHFCLKKTALDYLQKTNRKTTTGFPKNIATPSLPVQQKDYIQR